MTAGGVLLIALAIYCLSAALTRTLERRRLYRKPAACMTVNWTPPYAPDFQAIKAANIGGAGFTVEAISARRAAVERIKATDNTEFVNDLWAFRCKVCSTVKDNWLDAYECHKGSA